MFIADATCAMKTNLRNKILTEASPRHERDIEFIKTSEGMTVKYRKSTYFQK